MRFDSFNEVVSWYERTKPMISKHHEKYHDVRPIGARNRKWERIKKIDDNTYALLDGNYGRTIWGPPATEDAHHHENTMAPITWMRREDGDFIRIRNHAVRNTSVTRYNFLHWHLPSMMLFQYSKQGKHWVKAKTSTGYEEFQLPKCGVRYDYQRKVVHDDNVYLMFRVNEDGTFTRVSDKLTVEVKKVDKDLKKQWRERLDTFYNYCAAIAPMLDVGWANKHEYVDQLRNYMTERGMHNLPWIRNSKGVPTDIVREIVTDESHPMRVAYAALVIADIGGKRAIESQDDVRQIRAAYNRNMNDALGFYKLEKV